MRNATYLTEKYPGRESDLWTPCIYDFFCQYRPELPVSICIESPSPNGPWYESMKQTPFLKIDGEILKEPGPEVFLPKIGVMYGVDLVNDPARYTTRGDIAGIFPDILLIRPNRQGVYIIENKPYYESSFNGNQGPGGAYIDFIKWQNARGIPFDYLIIQSISSKNEHYSKVKQIQDELPGHFGILLFEDIFRQMANSNFTYEFIRENWADFTEKGSDYA